MTEYKTVTTQIGIDLINEHVLNNDEPFIASGWYIALGDGDLTPTKETTQLVHKIFDKDSPDYPGFVVEDNAELGRLAKITIPSSLEGNIIREIGLFNEDDELMVVASTHIDLSATSAQGLLNSFTAAISLKAIPTDVQILYVPEGDYVTHEIYDPFVASTVARLLDIGVLSNLSTTAKNDLVVAINEVLSKLDTKASINLNNLSSVGQAILDKKVEVEALLQQNGYAKFTWKENNQISILLQWGSILNMSGLSYGLVIKEITLPIAFQNSCVTALASVSNIDCIARTAILTNSKITFSIVNANNNNITDIFTWFAIGY